MFNDDIKCITANLCWANYVCHVTIIHFAINTFWKVQSFLIYAYGFAQRHMIGVTLHIHTYLVHELNQHVSMCVCTHMCICVCT